MRKWPGCACSTETVKGHKVTTRHQARHVRYNAQNLFTIRNELLAAFVVYHQVTPARVLMKSIAYLHLVLSCKVFDLMVRLLLGGTHPTPAIRSFQEKTRAKVFLSPGNNCVLRVDTSHGPACGFYLYVKDAHRVFPTESIDCHGFFCSRKNVCCKRGMSAEFCRHECQSASFQCLLDCPEVLWMLFLVDAHDDGHSPTQAFPHGNSHVVVFLRRRGKRVRSPISPLT